MHCSQPHDEAHMQTMRAHAVSLPCSQARAGTALAACVCMAWARCISLSPRCACARRYEDVVTACKAVVPQLRRDGAEIVIAMTHSKCWSFWARGQTVVGVVGQTSWHTLARLRSCLAWHPLLNPPPPVVPVQPHLLPAPAPRHLLCQCACTTMWPWRGSVGAWTQVMPQSTSSLVRRGCRFVPTLGTSLGWMCSVSPVCIP